MSIEQPASSPIRHTIRFFVCFALVWLARVLLFNLIDVRFSSQIVGSLLSLGFRIVIWLPAAWLYRQQTKPARGDKPTTRSIWIWCLSLLAIGIVWKAGQLLLKFDDRIELEFFSSLSLMFSAAVAEELLFRGAFLADLQSKLSFWRANLITAALFLIIHFPGWFILHQQHFDLGLVIDCLYIFGFSLVSGWVFRKSKSILPPIVLHAVNNLVSTS